MDTIHQNKPLAANLLQVKKELDRTPDWYKVALLNESLSGAQGLGGMPPGATKPTPSVAEQVKQKAGIMALQAQQQQAAQQQMMQQMAQAPQAVPQGVPQPEAQPQPQMMASGGIARLPVDPRMFNYRQGGVIGFDGESGSDVPNPRYPGMIAREGAGLMPRETGYEGMSIMEFIKKFGIDAYNKIKNAIPGESTEERLARQRREVYEASAKGQQEKSLAELSKPEPVDSMALPARPAMANDPRMGGLPSVVPKPPAAPAAGPMQKPPMPRPAPQAAPMPAAATPPAPQPDQAGVASLPSGFEQSLTQGIERAKAEQGMTPEQAKARYEATMPDELKQPAGLEQLARLKQQQAQYAKSQEDRPYERLMKVLGAAGRGGMGGFGSGYLGAVEGERAADAAQAAYQDKVMTAVEATRRGEATAKQKAMLDMIEKGDERKAKAISDQIQGSSSGYSTAQAAKTAAAGNLSAERIAAARDATSIKVAQISAAASREARAQGLDDAAIAKAEAAFAKDPRAQAIKKMLESPMYSMGADGLKRAKPLFDELEQIQRDKYAEFGRTLKSSPGAAKAAPALKYNPATGKIE